MEFYTQRELLEYLGKNPNDRSLVQRMMIRGEVLKRNGMYILLDKDRIITELEREVRELRNEIATMKESNGDLEVAKAQWDYYLRMAEEEREDKEKRIAKAFRWIKGHVKGANWDEFYEWLMSDEE